MDKLILENVEPGCYVVNLEFIILNIAQGTTIITDSWGGYVNVASHGYPHGRVNHSKVKFHCNLVI